MLISYISILRAFFNKFEFFLRITDACNVGYSETTFIVHHQAFVVCKRNTTLVSEIVSVCRRRKLAHLTYLRETHRFSIKTVL